MDTPINDKSQGTVLAVSIFEQRGVYKKNVELVELKEDLGC